jgi:hypothetical protein
VKRLLTPALFNAKAEEVWKTARDNVLTYGHAAEVLMLFDGRGREDIILNKSAVPFSQRLDYVRQLVRAFHATAGIHIAEAWMGFLTQGRAPEVDEMRPTDRPDREEVLIVCACWPLMKVAQARCASIIRSGDVVDLVSLDVEGALGALGLPTGGTLTATSWLIDVLPRHG